MSEEKQKITAKQWNKAYRMDEHDEDEIIYDSYPGEYDVEYYPERFTTLEGLNYSLGVWKPSENKTWLIAKLVNNLDSSMESVNTIEALVQACGEKSSYYKLDERKEYTTHKLGIKDGNVVGLRNLKNTSYCSVMYALRFFRHRAGIQQDISETFDGLKLVLVADCMNEKDYNTPVEIDRACQAGVKILHDFGDASQYMSYANNNSVGIVEWNIMLTRDTEIASDMTVWSSDDEHIKQNEKYIIEGVI